MLQGWSCSWSRSFPKALQAWLPWVSTAQQRREIYCLRPSHDRTTHQKKHLSYLEECRLVHLVRLKSLSQSHLHACTPWSNCSNCSPWQAEKLVYCNAWCKQQTVYTGWQTLTYIDIIYVNYIYLQSSAQQACCLPSALCTRLRGLLMSAAAMTYCTLNMISWITNGMEGSSNCVPCT